MANIAKFFGLIAFCQMLSICLFTNIATAQQSKSELINSLKNGSIYVVDEKGSVLLEHRSEEKMIPASTWKLATAFCALHTLGSDFRFTTSFYTDDQGTLFIKGSGDPHLVSEELAIVALELSKKIKKITRIVVDSSAFSEDLQIDGASNSTNPYDAINAAFVANFNTMLIKKEKNGAVSSAEPQTPLTNIARELSRSIPAGTQRVNIGKSQENTVRYGAELLSAFLSKVGVSVTGPIERGSIPSDAHLLLEHHSEENLAEVVKGLLEYSTNFSANQLFLILGATRYGYPATIDKGKRAYSECLKSEAGLKDFEVEEGSGLSRKNLISTKELVKLVTAFRPYHALLPAHGIFRAKTGTLTGVNSLAGIVPLDDGKVATFAILINSSVPADYKFRVAEAMYKVLTGKAVKIPAYSPSSPK